MKKYRLEVLGLSEMHLRGCGEREIGESVMIYSGAGEGRGKRRCGSDRVNERLLKV